MYIVDRLKDVVIRGGENVYCAEVEAVLFEHPAVRDVAVVGLPHEQLGEEVAAVVEPSARAPRSTAAELQEYAADRSWPASRCRRRCSCAAEPLPRTATGKVLKRDLRDELTKAGQ